MTKKNKTLLTVAVALLLAAGAAWAIKKRQGMTASVKLKSGKNYSVDSAYDQAGY